MYDVFSILEKHVGADRMDQPLLVWRPADQYFILLLEQIKLVCFPQYCVVFNHLNKVAFLLNYRYKFSIVFPSLKSI